MKPRMTIRRLKTIAIAVPIASVIGVEIVRVLVVGPLPTPKRLLLDCLVLAALSVFSLTIFRFIDQMQERLRRQNQELLALHSAGIDVTSDLTLDNVLKRVVEHARQLVGAKYGALSVIDDQGRIQAFITSGITAEERAAVGPPPVGHGLLGEVLFKGHHLRLADLTQHPRSAGFPPHHPPMRSLIAVPINSAGPFRGNLYLADKNSGDGTFSADDDATLERFAVHSAIAIDNAHLHAQVGDLAVAQERIRIAHEMHDGLAQVLGYVNTKVQAANEYLRRGKTNEATQQLRELAVAAREAYTDVRESIIGLRTLPGPERSFAEALRDYLVSWREQSGVPVTFTIDDGIALRQGVELQVIRIVQEALTNVRKHARATTARVEIHRAAESLVVTIVDDGSGFDTTALPPREFPRFGLTTMHERAGSIGGRLTIDSAPGRGTTITFAMPFPAASAEQR
jgi:signal transduction histidine kinase